MVAPGPPSGGGKGYQVRLYNQALRLANRHAITLLTFTGAEEVDADIVAACQKVTAIPMSPRSGTLAAMLHAPHLPLSVGFYRSSRMAVAVSTEVEAGHHDLVHLQMVRMATYRSETSGLPVVLDLLDAAQLNMHERAQAAPYALRQALRIESARLGNYERKAIASADLSLVISSRDLASLGSPPRARVLPNGIDPRSKSKGPPNRVELTVIFSGTMSYFPNADAAVWFARVILPLVRQEVAGAKFRIVGRDPTSAVRRLASLPGVTVTGEVPVVADELASAVVSVCPMRYGSGMQTKILEAMAVATPVVATSKAIEGLPEDLHEFIYRADSPDLFAKEIVRVLNDSTSAMERAAGAVSAIREHHTWRHSVDDLERLYEETVAIRRLGSIRS